MLIKPNPRNDQYPGRRKVTIALYHSFRKNGATGIVASWIFFRSSMIADCIASFIGFKRSAFSYANMALGVLCNCDSARPILFSPYLNFL